MAKYRVWLMLAICNLFWAGNYVFGKYVVAEMTPLWITFSRWLLAGFLLFPLAYYMEKPVWSAIKKDWFLLICMGLLGIVGFNIVLYSALEYTTATNAALVSALNPGVIVVSSVILYRERISLMQICGFCAALVGVVIVLTNGDMERLLQVEFNLGDLLMLAAVVIWTLYSQVAKRISIPPITATAISTGSAVLMLAPFALAQGIEITRLGPLAITGILYMAVFSSACSFVFWNMSVQEVGASKAGVFLNLIPVFTAIISSLLGERITGAQGLGGLLVLFGIYLTSGRQVLRKTTQE
jgi:drug/metabolite transporter (DMT)-like permease